MAKAKKKPIKKNTKAKTKAKPAKGAKGKTSAAKKAKAPAKAKSKTASKKTAKASSSSAVQAKVKSKAKTKLATSAKTLSPKTKTQTTSLENLLSPLDDRLVIELIEAPKMTAGGLYIPDSSNLSSETKKGQVLAVGRGHLNKKGRLRLLDVKLGDQVVVPAHSGSEIKLNGKSLWIVRESEVLGIVAR